MDVTGSIIQIGDVYNNNEGTFTKQEIVLRFMVGEYAKVAVLEAHQESVDKLAAFNIGDQVKAEFYLDGQDRAWNNPKTGKDRYFNVLKIRSIELVGDQPQAMPQYQAPPVGHAATAPTYTPPVMPTTGSVDNSDVPF